MIKHTHTHQHHNSFQYREKREDSKHYQRRKKIRPTKNQTPKLEFSAVSLKTEIRWNNGLKILNENGTKSRILFTAKLSIGVSG